MSRWDFGGNFADATAQAITDYVLEHGAAVPTSREIARRARMSPTSVSNHFGGREEMIRQSVASWTTFHAETVTGRVAGHGWAGFLPLDEADCRMARAWQCWRAIALARADLWQWVLRADRMIRERMTRELRVEGVTNFDADDAPIRVAALYLDALTAAVADPVAPTDLSEISSLWEVHGERLRQFRAAA